MGVPYVHWWRLGVGWSSEQVKSNSSGTSQDNLFSVVSANRMSEAIVEQIRALMRSNRLRPGDRLPSERDLCERFGVSRVTVREALRVLEAGGLVDIRVGARGGAFVTTPSPDRLGAVLGPNEAYLSLRGLKTLSLRMARQCDNALAVAEWLADQPMVERVYYPGLPDHPQHALAGRLLGGRYGAMLAFDLRDGEVAHTLAIVARAPAGAG